MTEETTVCTDPRDTIKLKHPEPDVAPDEPWQDDMLGRAEIAEKLTNLIRNQSHPFVISIDGQWGTGKTFLLKRWQKDLEAAGFKAIYFNAWEDDFCDDPLLSIIGQLSEQFKEGKFKKLAKQVGQIAVQLIKQNLIAVPSKLTGLDLRVDSSKLDGRDLLQEYSNQRKTKDRLKNKLTKLSAAVAEETGRPLVFIIDELDRCRPSFAIELLERVKHIFDVPNLVFVLGINRDELCKSFRSVYGDIDADVYLRRFFDMEFTLPEADSDKFCMHLMAQFGIDELVRSIGRRKSRTGTMPIDPNNFSRALSVFCSCLGLTLRDTVYCLSLVALAFRNLEKKEHLYPWVLGLLIPLKHSNPVLFRQFIQGERRASDVMDYIDGEISVQTINGVLEIDLDLLEAELYLVEGARLDDAGETTPWHQLTLLKEDSVPTHPDLLSTRTQEAGKERAVSLLRFMSNDRLAVTPRNALERVASLIELYDFVRK